MLLALARFCDPFGGALNSISTQRISNNPSCVVHWILTEVIKNKPHHWGKTHRNRKCTFFSLIHYKWNRMYNICIEYDSRHQAAEKHVHYALCTSTKRYRYPIMLYRVEPFTHKLFSFDRISNRIIKNCMNTINYVCSIYGNINNYCHSIVFLSIFCWGLARRFYCF